jgi:ribose transport system ATP-binding protein
MEATMANNPGVRPPFQRSRWLPIAAMGVLILGLSAVTRAKDAAFLSSFNLNGLMVATLPLALAAMAQTSALMVKAFDVSVGAAMTTCLVAASFVLGSDQNWFELTLGILFVLGIGIGIGAVHVALIRFLNLTPIIATLATYSIMQGIGWWLRLTPEGNINTELVDKMLYKVGFMPVALIVVALLAVLADVWLYRTSGGLAARAMGLDEDSASRRGVRVSFLFIRAFFISGFVAALGGLFLAAQIQIGDSNAGFSFTLTSIAAAVLGGASLLGGRGSFIGAVIGAFFLNLITNILPFLGRDASDGQIMVGLLTLLALSFYQIPELSARAKTAIANAKLKRGSAPTTAAEVA